MGPPINPYYYQSESSTLETTEASVVANELADFVWTWQESLLVIPLGLIVIGTIVGNFLVLYAMFTRSLTLRLPTHFLIANLSLADFLVGVLVMPFLTVLQLTGRWYFGSVYCEAWTAIHFWLCSASILSTCAVCIERYIGVRFPLKYKSIMNSKRICGMICCVWTLAGLLTFSSLYIWPQPKSGEPYVCEINQQIGHVIVAVVGILYVPAVIMIFFYLRIYVIATRHLNFMKKNTTSIPTSSVSDSSSDNNSQKGFARFFKRASNPNPNLTVIPEQDSSTSEVSISINSSSQESTGEQSATGHISNSNNDKRLSGFSSTSSTTTATTTDSKANWNNISLAKNVQSRKQFNLAKRLSLLVGVLLATYVPFFTLYMVMAFYPGSVNVRVFMAFGWIRYFNSCINPFIYALAVPAYRKAMLEIIQNAFKNVQRFFKIGKESM